MNTAPRIPAYLPASLGLLWLWSGLQPVLTAPQQSLELLAAVGFQTALRPPPAAFLGGAGGDGGGIQPDYCLCPACHVAAPLRAAGEKPADSRADAVSGARRATKGHLKHLFSAMFNKRSKS